MGATIPPSDASVRPARPTRLARFDGCERLLHWVNAVLFLVLLATAAILYVGSLSAVVGRRELVRQVHVISGLLLPVPFLVALAGPWRRGLRADIRAFNRFDADDRRWLRTAGRVSRSGRAARARVSRSGRAARARVSRSGRAARARPLLGRPCRPPSSLPTQPKGSWGQPH